MPQSRSTPQRTCVGCRQVADQCELVRHVLVDGVVVADPLRRAPGRGAWLHPDPVCLGLARRRGGFARSFRTRADVTELVITGASDAEGSMAIAAVGEECHEPRGGAPG